MSTTPPEDAPKPEPPPLPEPIPAPAPPVEPKPEVPPEPKARFKRYTLPVDRKDRAPRAAPLPSDGPRPKSNTLRIVLIVLGVLVGLPIAGCLFLWVLCAVGMR